MGCRSARRNPTAVPPGRQAPIRFTSGLHSHFFIFVLGVVERLAPARQGKGRRPVNTPVENLPEIQSGSCPIEGSMGVMVGRARLRRALIKPRDPCPTEEMFPGSLRCSEVAGLPSFGFGLSDGARKYLGSTESHPTGVSAGKDS